MGMFDNVRYSAPCPKCGVELTDWQSKDGNCALDYIEPYQVSNFYTSCYGCGNWIIANVDAEVVTIIKKCEVTLEVEPKRHI